MGDVTIVLRRPVTTLLGPLREAVRTGVLDERDERLAFRHDFISRRTVQTHLAHMFRKLDISSRVELATEATRRGDA